MGMYDLGHPLANFSVGLLMAGFSLVLLPCFAFTTYAAFKLISAAFHG